MADLAGFVAALYPDGGSMLEFRALPGPKIAFIRRNDGASARTFLKQPKDLYFGVATRKDASGGTKENCDELTTLFADLDFKGSTQAQARARLTAFPLPPSIVVSTGGGLHCYWLLREPIDVTTKAARDTTESVLHRLALALGADTACAEVARVLRVPGTKNHKYGPPRPVVIELLDASRRYNPSDFDEWIPAAEPVKTVTARSVTGSIAEGRRNAYLTSQAGAMQRRRMTPAAIVAALLVENTERCAPPLDGSEVRSIARSIARYEPDAPPVAARAVVLTRASAITMRPVHWLWDHRLALGAFGLLGGREGIGKSMAAAEISAAVTRGRLPGAFYGTARDVVLVTTEDSKAHTIVPRLVAHGADLDRVHFVTVTTPEGEADLVLPVDVPALDRVIREVSAVLVWFDPLLSRLDAQLDSHKDAEARRALEPLAKLADATGACFVGLIHVNKSATHDPLTLLMASRAFSAVARFVLFAMVDPDDDKRRLLGLAKSNLGRTDIPTLRYHVVPHHVATTADGEIWTGRLEWLGEAEGSIREALQNTLPTGDRTAASEAADWLTDYLTDAGGAADSAEIKRAGAKAGHTADHLRRARERLKLRAVSVGFPRTTKWMLPGQSGHAATTSLTTATTATTATTGEISRELTNSHDAPVVAVKAVVSAPARVATTEGGSHVHRV